jgi:hypothetical protein
MDLRKWSESEVEYGREVLGSALEGARSGREAFLSGRPLIPFLNESARKALVPAAVGACIGMLSGYAENNRQRSLGRALVFSLLGGVIGFGTGVAWESRRLTANAANGALRNIHKVRDEHWLEKHPVAYD